MIGGQRKWSLYQNPVKGTTPRQTYQFNVLPHENAGKDVRQVHNKGSPHQDSAA